MYPETGYKPFLPLDYPVPLPDWRKKVCSRNPHILSDMDNLLKVLALANYEVVYLVDYRKKQYRKILAKPAIDPLYPETGELNDAAMRTYLDSVLPEDREKLIRETQPEHVLLATREHGKIVVPYRRLSPGGKTALPENRHHFPSRQRRTYLRHS